MVTNLEPDIMQCEIKWALGIMTTNKSSGGNGIPAELFQMLKDDAVNVLHSICWQIWKTQQWPQDWKRSIFIPVTNKGNVKECLSYQTIVLVSCSIKVMLKSFRLGFSCMWINWELPGCELDLERAEEPDQNCIDYISPWLCESQQTVENS